MRPLARLATVVVAGVLSLGTLAAPAQAASPLVVSSTPAAGAQVKTAPGTISITFDQKVATTSTISVAGPAGNSGACSQTAPSAPTTTISCSYATIPPPTRNDGPYTVSYVAKSTGADPEGTGSFLFTLDTAAPAAPTGLTIAPSPYLASSDSLTVTGTSAKATDSVAVTLSGGASVNQNVTPAADRTFSATFTGAEVATLTDGTITASVTSTDLAGNTSTAATRTATKDSSRPAITTTDPADGGSKKPASFAYTAQATETLGAASHVDLFDATLTQIATTDTVTTTSVKATPGMLPDGAYTARIYLVDTNGNTGTADGSPTVRTFTIDNTAPAAPVITTPLPTINLANQAAFPVSGTGEAGVNLTLTIGIVTKTVVVGSGGAWSLTVDVSVLTDGNVSATARQTDAAGNQGPVSATAATTKDTIAPAVTGQAVSPATMGSTTLVATVTGSVTNGVPVSAAAPEPNDPVKVTADDTDPATAPVVVMGQATASANFSIQVDTSPLSDGTITYRIVATDSAGNPSSQVTTTNTKDAIAPGAPTVTISPKPVNNTNKAAITVAGTTTGTTVSITLTDGTTTIGPFAPTVSGGAYSQSVNTTMLADGTITASVTSKDTAGNQGPAGTATATKDTGVPTPPTNVTVPTFIKTGALPVSGDAEPGSTVTVVVSDAAALAATAASSVVVPADGHWSLSVNVSGLADGGLTLSVKAADTAGNTSPATSPAPTSTKDTVTPEQPATLTATPSPYVPTSTTFTVAGTTSTVDRAATLTVDVTVSDSSGTTDDLTMTNAPVTPGVNAGTFSVAFTATQLATLRDGNLTMTAVFGDQAGNRGPARTTTAVKDATPLALASTAPDTMPNGNGGTVVGLTNTATSTAATFNEAITPTTNPVATRSTITVTNKNGITLAGSGNVSGAGITFTPSSPFSDAGSPFVVSVHAVDAALTSETKDITYSFNVDTTAPAAPVMTSTTDPVNAANQTMVQVSGTAAEQGRTVTVSVGSVSATPTVGAGGTWSTTLDLSPVADGTRTVTATQTDAAGNTSQAGTRTITKDTVAPVRAAGTPAGGSTVQPPSTVRIQFTEPLASGSISIPGVAGTSTVDGDTVVFTPAGPIPDGAVTATATVTDAVGNPGTGSTTFTVDGTGPSVTGLAATDATFADPTTTVTGSRSETATVAVSATDGTQTVTATVASGAGAFSVDLDLSAFTAGTVTLTAVATDEVGNIGPTAIATAMRTTTPPTSTTTLDPLPAVVRYGTRLTLAGQVTRVDDSQPYGTVHLVATTNGGTEVDLGTVRPDASGAFTRTLKPSVNARYQASYDGDSAAQPSSSGSARTDVAFRVTSSGATGPASAKALVTGKVTPRVAGRRVRLYVLEGGRYVKVATTTTTAQGGYTIKVALPKGRSKLEARVEATSDNAAGSVRFAVTRT